MIDRPLCRGAHGYISPWMIGILMAAAISIYALLSATGTGFLMQRRRSEYHQAAARLNSITAQAISLLRRRGIGEADSPRASYMISMDALVQEAKADGVNLQVCDISSRLNPNWMAPFMLERTKLNTILRAGKTPAMLQQFRQENGFSLHIEEFYRDWFSTHAIDSLLTPYSYANINIDDEFSLRRLYEYISRHSGELFQAEIQGLRKRSQFLTPLELPQFFGESYRRIHPVIHAGPAMNIHYVPEEILHAVLSYPYFNIDNPQTVTQQIISHRNGSGIKAGELPGLLQVPPDSPLLQYLGVQTYFWRIDVHFAEYVQTTIVAVVPQPQEPEPYRRIRIIR
ncbi:MAG: hypothetical protein ACOC0D_03905, partial [Spirochaeta sp.]